MKIAIIGAGLMGSSIAIKLKENSYDVVAYNRTIQKIAKLKEHGIEISDSVKFCINESDILLLLLSDYDAIQSVILQDNLINLLKNKTIIQMGTILPDESIELHKVLTNNDVKYFEAPVLGSVPQIMNSNLIVMCAGDEELLSKNKVIFSAFSKDIYFIGEVGKAAALKLALNNFIASHIIAFSLSYGIVEKTQIDSNTFMDILRKSALYAPMFDNKLPLIQSGDFSKANFPTKHLLKDIRLINELANNLKLNSNHLSEFIKITEKAIRKGYADLDYSSIFKAILDD